MTGPIFQGATPHIGRGSLFLFTNLEMPQRRLSRLYLTAPQRGLILRR